MRLGYTVRRRIAATAEVEAAWARLDDEPGIYFGCDAGVAGLHPLQATLLVAPAIALRLFADGATVEPLDAFGTVLLRHPALAAFVGAASRGGSQRAVEAARAFLAAFSDGDGDGDGDGTPVAADRSPGEGRATADRSPGEHRATEGPAAASADALWIGALRFEGHRLASSATASASSQPASSASDGLGILFFAPTVLRRDAAGAWSRVSLHFDDAKLESLATQSATWEATPRLISTRSNGDSIHRLRTSATRGPSALRELASGSQDDARLTRQEDAPPTLQDDAPPTPQDNAPPTPQDDATPTPQDDFPLGGYAAVVGRAVERLRGEALVSLTLSQSFRRRVGNASAAAAFATLRRVNPAPVTFMLNDGEGGRLFGASPDLQLVVKGRTVESLPVCGTVARGRGPVGEAESFRLLINEAVDAASLAVCTDALRNDLAPCCEPGSLRLLDRRRPLALATVVHTVDRLAGRLRDGVDAWDAILATAAPVMVTGTPRRPALAAIEALEAGPRGWYGGLVVQVAASGDALVGTILRAAWLQGGVAEVRTGGDLMADSDPAREEHESRIKAVSLWRALGLAVDADLQAAPTTAGGSLSRSSADADKLPRAVALQAVGDPFEAALAEALQALGLVLDPGADTVVRAGPAAIEPRADAVVHVDASGPRPGANTTTQTGAVSEASDLQGRRRGGLVAVGDAAARVLAGSGFAVVAIRPEHGRLVQCRAATANANANANASVDVEGLPTRPFVAMRYATLALDDAGLLTSPEAAEWSVWIHDDDGRPLVLAHAARRTVCLLFRPESLLSDPAALEVLRAAIAFASVSAR